MLKDYEKNIKDFLVIFNFNSFRDNAVRLREFRKE